MAATRVKICGITNREDALCAVEVGADALGFVFYSKSPRCVTSQQAQQIVAELPPFVSKVGLFVNEDPVQIRQIMETVRLDVAQLHGDETPQDCRLEPLPVIKALRVKDATSLAEAEQYPVAALLLDAWSDRAYGGTGECFDWQLLKNFASQRPVILAGGLNPQNVATAIETVRPYAVDVSSGVEQSPGKKDRQKVAEFIRRVRNL